MSDYGIPYMGSKAKIAPSICMALPKATHFYDLFGGGFSMTHCMLERFPHKYSHFHYNEIKTDIVDIVKRSIQGEFNYAAFKPEWVSREDFFAKKDTDAYIRCIWSFGNNQRNYLFNPDIEEYKRSMHQAVVFDEFDELAASTLGFKKWPSIAKTIKQKRIYLRQKIEHYRVTEIPKFLHKYLSQSQLSQLHTIDNLRKLQQLERLQQLEQLERLEQLEQLEQLERLERLERLSFYSDSYEKIEILPNSVVYCDIPYKGTADYGNDFNHKKFFDWASSRNFPVYISEYNIGDDRFKGVYSIGKRVLLNDNDKKLIKSEKLYWNGVKNV
jgi:hypothetical protein